MYNLLVDTNKLTANAQEIKDQASALLQSTQLLDILSKYGDIHLIGSYPLDIMYGSDIDIVVESNDIRKSSVDALNEIVDKQLFRKIEYGDFVKFPMEKRPQGYILVLKAVVEDVKWEIEVWFLEDVSKQLNYHKALESKLNEQNRINILEAKHLRATSDTSKHELSSYKIYEEILGKMNE